MNEKIGFAAFNPTVIAKFSANAGQIDNPFSAPLLLLTSIGAKSGKPHVTH